MASVGSSESDGNEKSKFIVEDGNKFNAILKLCLGHLQQAFEFVLKTNKRPNESKMWPKLNKFIKMYTSDMVKIIGAISSVSVLSALLKHVHGLVPFYADIPKSGKMLLKSLINVWSTHKDDQTRVLAYVSILRLTRINMKHASEDTTFFEMVLKQMYMAYIRNVKFTSPSVWPAINFMRRSLAEMFRLEQTVCYRYAFVYIRQLTIHLRNALIHGKAASAGKKGKKGSKDTVQSVYNWQFVHSVHLWTQLLCDSYPSQILEPLIYPLIQLVSGAIKLVYSAAYFPLRFHLARLLTQLSVSTGKYVPVLPYYLDILQTFEFGKKTQKVSMKPMNFSCILRLSKSQMAENGFKDAVVEQVYAGMLDNLSSLSNKISFPEIIVPAVAQLRSFTKKCSVQNYCKKMRQLLDKINENSKFVLERRRKINGFGVRDVDKIEAWEAKLRADKPPLLKYNESWKAVNEKNVMKNMTKERNDEFETTKLPSDDDSDDDEEAESEDEEEEEEEKVPQKNLKRKPTEKPQNVTKKKLKQDEEDVEDEGDKVTDFNLDDFGNESGSDSESDEDQEEEEEEQEGEEEESDTDESD